MKRSYLYVIGALLTGASLGGCTAEDLGIGRPTNALAELRRGVSSSPAIMQGAPKPADEETVAAPVETVGSEWQFDDGYGLIVVQVNGPTARFRRTDDPDQWIVRRGFMREDSQSHRVSRKFLFSDAPPDGETGLTASTPLIYRREFTSNGANHSQITSWTVEGRAQISVPAGQFDCYVIVMRARSLTDDWTGFERWWYSPQVKNYVRMEYQYGSVTGSRVLTHYNLVAPNGAVPLRTKIIN